MTQPKSAYEIWLELGNTGSKEDFLNSLKGADAQDSALPGPAGTTATIEIGEVLTGEAGTAAVVQNVGTDTAAKLNFTIPRGEKGLVGDVNLAGPIEDETITCNIEDLQSIIDNLPKFLNKNVTINVNPGITDNHIHIEHFFGYGALNIRGADSVTNTHSLKSFYILNCKNHMDLSGFNITADGINIETYHYGVSVNNCSLVSISYFNITGGEKTNGDNWGIWNWGSKIHIYNTTISNKSTAIASLLDGTAMVHTIFGTGNNVCFGAYYGGTIRKIAPSSITGTTLNGYGAAGLIINTNGGGVGS
jgi:hypothetical protein